MRISEWYDKLNTIYTAANIPITFEQPTGQVPITFVNVHTDGDMSSKTDTLQSVEQQIDVYVDKQAMSRADWEDYIRYNKHLIAQSTGFVSMTCQTSIDDSTGKDLYRAMILVTIEI